MIGKDVKRKKILLINGKEDIKVLLREIAEEEGYEVAITIGDSWAILSRYRPDVVIIDSDTKGWELCRKIKNSREISSTKVLLVSSREEVGERIQAYRLGAEGIVVRPIKREEFLLKIKDILKKEGEARPSYVHEEGIKGSLKDMGLPDLIQVLNMGQKTALIYLTNGQEEGRIFMENGDIVHGTCGPCEGEEAIYRLLKWQDGRFEIEPGISFPVKTIDLPVEELLLEGMRRMDEEKKEGKKAQDKSHLVEPESFNLIKNLYELGILERKE